MRRTLRGVKGYRLKIKRLDFISAVDAGAQGPVANVALIKRAPDGAVGITCKVAKLDEKLGLVFGWAMAGTTDGGKTDHVDLQSDAIEVNTDDFIKACAEFMEAGAAADVMHDGKADGRVVFAMPLVKQVNDALGIQSDVQGLAIAMKPSAETFKRFVSGELAAFSIGGVGEREPLPEQKRAPIRKEAVLTSTDAGHAHTVSLDDPARYWCDQLQTSYQTAEGADCGHSHAWIFDPKTGAITVADDSGHSHTIDASVPADVLALYAVREAQRDAQNLAEAAPGAVTDDPSDGIPTAVPVEESSGSARVVIVQARAPQSKSTPSHREPQGDDMKLVILSEAQHAHYSKLSAAEQEAFVNKSATERDADVEKALDADPIVFKGEKSGLEVRKSQGDFALKLAKQAEENAVTMAKQADELAKRDAAIEKADIRKQAEKVLGGMPGDDATHDAIIGALRKSLTGDALDKAIATLNGMRETSTIGKRASGVGGDAPETGPLSAFNAELAEFAKSKNQTPVQATAAFMSTPRGAELYAQAENFRLTGQA